MGVRTALWLDPGAPAGNRRESRLGGPRCHWPPEPVKGPRLRWNRWGTEVVSKGLSLGFGTCSTSHQCSSSKKVRGSICHRLSVDQPKIPQVISENSNLHIRKAHPLMKTEGTERWEEANAGSSTSNLVSPRSVLPYSENHQSFLLVTMTTSTPSHWWGLF